MAYNVDYDPMDDPRYGAIRYPDQAAPRPFIDKLHAGEFGAGYGSLAEAVKYLRRGTVVCPADDGKYYVVARWVAKRYYRYLDGAP